MPVFNSYKFSYLKESPMQNLRGFIEKNSWTANEHRIKRWVAQLTFTSRRLPSQRETVIPRMPSALFLSTVSTHSKNSIINTTYASIRNSVVIHSPNNKRQRLPNDSHQSREQLLPQIINTLFHHPSCRTWNLPNSSLMRQLVVSKWDAVLLNGGSTSRKLVALLSSLTPKFCYQNWGKKAPTSIHNPASTSPHTLFHAQPLTYTCTRLSPQKHTYTITEKLHHTKWNSQIPHTPYTHTAPTSPQTLFHAHPLTYTCTSTLPTKTAKKLKIKKNL